MNPLEKVLQEASRKVLENINRKLRKEEMMAAFKKGMDNAIYNYPLKQYKPLSRYRRTGNLKKAVRFTKFLPGPASPKLRAKVYLDDAILARLYNPMSKDRMYGRYTYRGTNTGDKANHTAKGLGWYPFAKQNIINFILKDVLSQGIV